MKKVGVVKNTEKKKSVSSWIFVFATVAIAVAVALGIVFVSLRNEDAIVGGEKSDDTENTHSDEAETTENAEKNDVSTFEYVESTFESSENGDSGNFENNSEKTLLAPGIEALEILAVSGSYTEDGSFDRCENVAAVRIKNISGRTIEALAFKLMLGGKEYSFSVSMLSTGRTLVVLDLGKQTLPEKTDGAEYTVEYCLFLEEEKDNFENEFAVEVSDGTIRVTNITATDINDEIIVYYKNTNGDIYCGGLTYKVRLKDGIAAGNSIIATASHAVKDKTEIILIEKS